MKQKNKNNLRKKAEVVYAIRSILSTLKYHILVMGSVFIVATIFSKYIEAICFLTSFFSLRYKFPTTYHSDSIVVCMTLTISIFGVSIILCPPITMYVIFSIGLGYLDAFMLWFIKDRQDRIEYNKILEDKINELSYKQNLYSMTETELRSYAQSKGLCETICDTLALRVVHNYRWVDIQKELNYTKDGIRYHKEQIIKKLGNIF